MSQEIWKPVISYEGLYEVSDLGRIKSLDRLISGKNIKGIYRKINKDTNGYNSIMLCKDLIHSRIRVHRIVAQVFITNPDNKPDVNHIDGNKENNRADNLEWVTKSENHLHRVYSLGKRAKGKNVGQFTIDGKLISTFKSLREAARCIKGNSSNIAQCCKGVYITSYGYKWKYI